MGRRLLLLAKLKFIGKLSSIAALVLHTVAIFSLDGKKYDLSEALWDEFFL